MRTQRFGGSCFVLLVTLLTLLVIVGEASAQAVASPDSLSTVGGGDVKTREQEPEQQESEEEFKRHKILFLYATGWVRQSPESRGSVDGLGAEAGDGAEGHGEGTGTNDEATGGEADGRKPPPGGRWMLRGKGGGMPLARFKTLSRAAQHLPLGAMATTVS